MAKRTRKFKTEVQQLLDLVIHSLYSKKEIFLRELVSNASDAIDRLRFEALTDGALLQEGEEWKIKIHVDRDARTVTVSDNGIGMNAEELESHLGTIANSGTRNFLDAVRQSNGKADADFIGQFGVGFYASFMAADSVTVLTRRAGADAQALRWISKGDGTYAVEEAEKASRGTDVVLHLREGMDEYLDTWRLRQIIKHYSDYIAYPIVMDIEKTVGEGKEKETRTEEETVNSRKAIWKKTKSEVSDEEYKEFYHHISHDFGDPLRIIHYAAEGTTEFRALLYIPESAPFDLFFPERKGGIHLYVRNVFITDDCRELLPEYLRFVRGVVDSSDLPLNVSREMLQDDAVIRRIHKSLVGRILNEFSDIKDSDREAYRKLYAEFGSVLKEGLHSDFENQDKLRELVMYASTKTEEGLPVSLREYVDRMPSSQKDIYFLTAANIEAARNSPHLETFKAHDYEVLFMVDPIDEFALQRLTEYDGRKLKAVDKGDIDLGDGDEGDSKTKREEADKEFGDLLAHIAKQLDDDVKDVRLSRRLTDSVACLVADEMGMNAHLERLMRAMHRDVPKTKRTLELNPTHPVLHRMKSLFDADAGSDTLRDFVDLVYDQALLAEGSPVRDASRFTRLVSRLMAPAD
jgi:molecular chaperone HtpG